MLESLLANPDFIKILTAFVAIVTISAGIIGLFHGLKGATRKAVF
jgi:hypothetical protein